MTAPTLPQDDPDAAGRAKTRADAREAYTYDYSYQGLCFTGELPKSEGFDAPYVKQSLEATAKLKANRAGSSVKQAAEGVFETLKHAPGLREITADVRNAKDTGRVGSIAEYEAMFQTLPKPDALPIWDEDWAFAWQRVAGSVPTLLERVDAIPDHFPVEPAHFEAALGEGASLEAARAEGRLFLIDYRRFDGIPCGVYPPDDDDGAVQKYLHAPLALFCATKRDGLRPVAIQTSQHPDAGIVTPADGVRWKLAKAVVQVADANEEGIVVHFGYTHMIVQRFILAARRQLSSRHPILALLVPHFRYTLAANDYSRKDLVTPNGTQDRVLAPQLEATLAVLRESIREVSMDELDPAVAAERAGVDDASVLEHPFRDDQLTVWAPVKRWVEGYVALYYPDDAAVAADVELAAMVDEIGSPDGGRLPRLVGEGPPKTRAALVAFCARLIHRASTYHAAINYNWYDWMAFVPNLPAAQSIPMPAPGAPVTEQTLLDLMPPRGLGWEQLAQVWSVDSLHVNFLGDVPPGHFTDPRVAPRLEAFRAELKDAEAVIEARNQERRLPYRCLLPSRITASINS